MFADWNANYGFTSFSEVGRKGNKRVSKNGLSAVSNYVAKYCLKPRQLQTEAELRTEEYINQCLIPAPFYLMSKGIGNGYIKRMKRWHLFGKANPSIRVPKIVDRAVYHDGAFTYKLPRFYKDRLYRMKFPCDAKVWNQKLKCYVQKIVYRYQSKNLLSLQMQAEIRNRLLADYNDRIAELRSANPRLSDSEIHLEMARLEASSRMARQKDIFSKMSRFYNTNRFKNRKF